MESDDHIEKIYIKDMRERERAEIWNRRSESRTVGKNRDKIIRGRDNENGS